MIIEAIQVAAESGSSPDGKAYAKLSLHSASEIAGRFSCSLKDVEIIALENGVVPERYQRSLGTIGGAAGQITLLKSQAAVIGLGGLGGLAAELLARMGIGSLVLVDGDFFSESNLNRQVLCTENNLGRSKALEAAARIKEINSALETRVVAEFIKPENAEDILRGSQVVLDCLDNLQTRFLLQKSCRKLGLPMIHGAIAQFYGQVSTIFPGDSGFDVIYGSYDEGKETGKGSDGSERGIEKELGNPATTPAIVAAWQVQEALKLLLGREPLLRNCLFYIDSLTCACEIIALK